MVEFSFFWKVVVVRQIQYFRFIDAKEISEFTTNNETSAAASDENLSGNSNENTETSDNTVRELDLNGCIGHDGSVEANASGSRRISSTESAVSNVTIEETIYLPIEQYLPTLKQTSSVDSGGGGDGGEKQVDEEQRNSLHVLHCKAPPNSFETATDTLDDVELIEYIVTYEENESDTLQRRGSCLSRGSSSKNSIKKRVNLNESAEIIPNLLSSLPLDSKQPSTEEDDEVFSDSVPAKLPRGNMCTPFITKRGSIPGLAALPDWFREEK